MLANAVLNVKLCGVVDSYYSRQLCELRDHVNTSELVTPNIIPVLLGELCIEW